MNSQNEIKFLKHRSIIKFEGSDFLGEIGIDGRIFKALTYAKISVGIISQQAIENGTSILVQEKDSEKAVACLMDEFEAERISGKVNSIYSINHVSVLGFVTTDFDKILSELARNNVFPLLLNQISSENRVNIVVASSQDEKSKNIIEALIFRKPKVLHLALIGHGNVGSTLIQQILDSKEDIKRRKNIELKIVGISNSRKQVLDKNGISENWISAITNSETTADVDNIITFAKDNQLENLVIVDNTASKDFINNYPKLAENGFDLVSSNKIFNTLPIEKYRNLRYILAKNNRQYRYETNVGAGLPLIDTIKLLHTSGENITRIKGVFSGSLSYIFNNFSVRDEKFSTIIKEAMDFGFTEPDPREDLSGSDVARKLLILSRELDLINEFSDIKIQNLISQDLLALQKDEFISKLDHLDSEYQKIKDNQEPEHVLRYVGDLHGDLQKDKGELDVKLISVPASSALGQLKGSDSIFEIYTESYGENPIVIMGAGAGAKVTARGVFGDILRLSETK